VVEDEADWAANVDEYQVDYDSTPTPPESGAVILEADPGAGNIEGEDVFNTSHTRNEWYGGGEWLHTKCNNNSDSSYLISLQFSGFYYATGHIWGAIDLDTLLAIDENVEIYSVKIVYRARYDNQRMDKVYSRFMYNGSWYTGTRIEDTVTGSWAEYEDEWLLNPQTSEVWTRDDLALISLLGMSTDNSSALHQEFHLSSLKIIVTTSAYKTDGYIETEFDLSEQSANHNNDMLVAIAQREPTGSSLTHELKYPEGGISKMWPTGDNDIGGDTTNDDRAYDDDDSTFSYTVPTGSGWRFYVGRTAGDVDAWETEPDFSGNVYFKAIVERVAGDVDMVCGAEESDATLVGLFIAQGSGNFSKQEVSIDVTAYKGDLADLRCVVVSLGSGTTVLRIYDTWIEGEVWGDGVQVKDGSRVPTNGAEEFRIKSSFTSSGTVTPVLSSITLEIPDHVWRYSTHRLPNWPYPHAAVLQDIPGRTIELDIKSYITKTSKMSVKLNRTETVMDMLRSGYLKNYDAQILFGFLTEDLVENDLMPYYIGRVKDFKNDSTTCTISIKDIGKNLDTKWPEGIPPATKPSKEFADYHLVDVLREIIGEANVTTRYVEEGSFYEGKLNCGSDPSIPLTSADWITDRTIANGNEITDPKSAKAFITEILELIGGYLIAQENGKFYLVIYTASKGPDDFWDKSVFGADATFEGGLKDLRNAFDLWYDWAGTGSEYVDFDALFITDDPDSKANYAETARRIIKSRWVGFGSSAGAGDFGEEMSEFITARESARLRNGLGVFDCDTRLDRAGVQVGDFIEINSEVIAKSDIGKGDSQNFMVVKKKWNPKANKMEWTLVEAR